MSLTPASLRGVRDRGTLPVLRRGPDRPGRCGQAGQDRPVLLMGTRCDCRSAASASATADAGRNSGAGEAGTEEVSGSDGPQSAVPGWLADLARSAEQMPVPAGLRPPAEGGRHSAILILFGSAAEEPATRDLHRQ